MAIPQTIQFASLGMADSLILMVLALVVFGPRRLPQIGRQIGKLMYEFRKASNDFKFQMEEELRNAEEADRRQKEEERLKTLSLAAPAAETPAAEPAAGEAAAPVESPYPWESVYPSITPATPETTPEETTPQIAPPADGETVAATPPRRVRRKRTVPPPATGETVGETPAPAAQVQLPYSPEAATEEAKVVLAPEAGSAADTVTASPSIAAGEAGGTPEAGIQQQPGTSTQQAPQHG
jgi:sec-independent protein translocase protein TatB